MDKHLYEYIQEMPTSARDMANFFLGDKIGTGMNRDVYKFPFDETYIVKYEYAANKCFQNVIEWEFWETVKNTSMAKWFAPCLAISQNGLYLIQKKVEMIPRDQFPKKVPRFFTDLKYENFGKIGKAFVAFDYGTMHIGCIDESLSSKKTKKAEWK